jgi:hypothetical protein
MPLPGMGALGGGAGLMGAAFLIPPGLAFR